MKKKIKVYLLGKKKTKNVGIVDISNKKDWMDLEY